MKQQLQLLVFLVFLLSDYFLVAQEFSPTEQVFSCGFDELRKEKNTANESYNNQRQAFRKVYTQQNIQAASKTEEVYTLPTVIHIIHNNKEVGSIHNPTNESVQAKIGGVNHQMRFGFADEVEWDIPFAGVDTKIQLCLASVAPNGTPTTGVIRYNRADLAIDPDKNVLRTMTWEESQYYNVFLVEDLTGGISGYFTPDLVVIQTSQGSFNFPTFVHETGHYLGLLHTFESGCSNNNCLVDGDEVCDTPPAFVSRTDCENPENSCTTDEADINERNPYRPTNLGGMGDQPDFSKNYMGYSFCFPRFFTIGQKALMRMWIEEVRMTQIQASSTLCTCPTTLDLSATHSINEVIQVKEQLTSSSIVKPNVSVTYQASQSITLQPDFHAKEGAIFAARILADPCAATLIPITTENSILKQAISEQAILDQTAKKIHIKVFPNPSTTSTNIQFTLPTSTAIQLQLYDLNGQLVQPIIPTSTLEAGNHSIHWENNRNLAGMYFLQLTSSEERVVKKVLLLN